MSLIPYRTRDGANQAARSLLKALRDGSGFVLTQSQLRDPIAQAAGFASWHELHQADAIPPAEPAVWRVRLLKALPVACHAATLAWLDREALSSETWADDMPPRWFADVYPYWIASMGLHRRHTALIRRGSGAGQILREGLIVGLLINQHGGSSITPRLEPRTLALVYRGDLPTLYKATAGHPDFQREFGRLIEAGLIDWRPEGRDGPELTIMAPPGLQEAVETQAIDMAAHWHEVDPDNDEVEIRLAQMLRVLRIPRPDATTRAMMLRDAAAHTVSIGPMSEVLSTLASEGSLRAFALVFDLFGRLRPGARRTLAGYLPAKVVSQYLPRSGVTASAFHRWTQDHPHWAEAIETASETPEALVRLVSAMEAELKGPEPLRAA